MDGFISFIEWANINLDTVKNLIRGNLGFLVTMAYMICFISPIIFGFMFKSSLFRLRQTLGGEFVLDLKFTFGSVIIPTLFLFLIINKLIYLFNDIIITLALISTATYIFGSFIATALHYYYLMITLKDTLERKADKRDLHSIKAIFSSIFSLIIDTLKFILTSFILYCKNIKKSDGYLIYYSYLNKYSEEKLENIKVSKLMVSLIYIYSISFLIIITVTTYSFLEFLVG